MFGRLLRALRPEPDETALNAVDTRTLVKAAIFDPVRSVVAVVGESYRQDVLETLAGARGPIGVQHRNHLAVLLAEPSNPADTEAVAVQVNGELVGYLARADARRYRPVIDRTEAHGLRFGCHARLTGGWDRGVGDRGSIGVALLIGTPVELMQELDEMVGAAPGTSIVPAVHPKPVTIATVPVPSDLAGKSVCFTGPSRFIFQGAEVSRGMQELLAVQHGMTVLSRVTKKLDILVACRPTLSTGKTTKAVAYGTIIVDEAAFWTAVDVVLEPA